MFRSKQVTIFQNILFYIHDSSRMEQAEGARHQSEEINILNISQSANRTHNLSRLQSHMILPCVYQLLKLSKINLDYGVGAVYYLLFSTLVSLKQLFSSQCIKKLNFPIFCHIENLRCLQDYNIQVYLGFSTSFYSN